MNRVVKVVVIVAAIVIVILVVVFQLTSGIVNVAGEFFTALETGDFTTAYGHTSSGFQSVTSLNHFQSFAERTGLTDFASVRWTERTISGGEGVLHGQLTTSSGDVVPLTVTLVKEDETWRIHSVDADYGGFATDQGQEIPAEDELKKMVTASMVDLGRAINAGDFTDFHGNIAELWQRQITNEELLNAFQAFVDAELDLTTVQGLEPILSAEPYFDDQGALTVDGHYPTEWGETHFHLRYFYEDPKWKLVGVNVRVE